MEQVQSKTLRYQTGLKFSSVSIAPLYKLLNLSVSSSVKQYQDFISIAGQSVHEVLEWFLYLISTVTVGCYVCIRIFIYDGLCRSLKFITPTTFIFLQGYKGQDHHLSGKEQHFLIYKIKKMPNKRAAVLVIQLLLAVVD